MKTIRNIIFALALLALPAFAQDYFTYTGAAQGGTNSYVIITGKHTGVPSVYFVDATVTATTVADMTNAAASVVFWTAGPDQKVTRAGVTGTNTIYVAATNGWAVGDTLILTRVQETAFERHTVSALTGTNLTITGTTTGPTVAGDKIYKMTVAGRARQQPGASGYIRLAPGNQPYFSGIEGRPSLVEMQGTQTNTLNTVSGRWLPTTFGK